MTKTNSQTATKARAAKAKGKAPKLTAEQADKIALCKGVSSGGAYTVVKSAGGETFTLSNDMLTGKLNKLCAVGGSYAAAFAEYEARKAKAPAKLANGITARQAPQSAKAVADNASKGKSANKADAVQAKGKAKADKGSKGSKRDLTITLLVKPADAGVKGGRLAKLEAVAKRKPKTVADIIGVEVTDASGKTHTIDMGAINGMVRRNHVKLG